MADFKNETEKIFIQNRRTVQGHQFTVPSPDTYPYQWFWDSCFHAIILAKFDTKDAKTELESLISKQQENGMIPHIIYWDREVLTDFPDIKWRAKHTSSITQPPMIAYAVKEIFLKDSDKKFLENIYGALHKFYMYILKNRDPHNKNLVGIVNPDESGEDNSPRFDLGLRLPIKHTLNENNKKRFKLAEQDIEEVLSSPFRRKKFFWIKDVPFNSILIKNLEIMSELAEILGNNEDKKYFSEKSDLIKKAMREIMLEDGICLSVTGKNYDKIKVKTWSIFAPLFANVYTKEETENIIQKYLLNKNEFYAKYLVPTVSFTEPVFDPNGFWRGPVWIATNWFIYKGLLNYGYKDLAQKIKSSSLELISKSGFREYFNPLTGEGLGARDFTWGGLVLDMN